MTTQPTAGTIDLNADLGEEVTDDAALLAVVTTANVACGYHAGSAAIMRAVCEESVRRGVAVGDRGLHPRNLSPAVATPKLGP